MYSGDPLAKNPAAGRAVPGSKSRPVPIIRLYGVNDDGNSVLLHVHGFTPYFYVVPPPGFKKEHLGAFRSALDYQVKNSKKGGETLMAHVLAVTIAPNKQSLMGYHGDTRTDFLKVYLAMPTLVPTARGILERGFDCPGYGPKSYQCFEANVPFVLRFMIDTDLPGCSWVELPKATYSVRDRGSKVSSCQIEADVVYESMIAHPPDGEWQRVAPLRILSFDIECAGRKGHFPEPEHDPVIQIANTLTVQGERVPRLRNVFTLGSCTAIVGATVLPFRREPELLESWSRFVREADVDLITGYNIANFDIPYLMNRAEKLRVTNFSLMGRIVGQRATMKNTTFSSAAYGKSENIVTTIDGRVIFDMLTYMRRNHNLSSYSLNAVSAHFLGQQKEDVHHSIISDLQNGTDDDRRRLAMYCLKDALLPQRLMDKLMVVVNYLEMSRVTGVPLEFLLQRGQQIKVLSMLYRKCKTEGLLIPSLRRDGGDAGAGVAYEGATVIEPLRAFYDEPIATLDFASLYPSIMMAHNLCYSTLVAAEDVKKLDPSTYEKTPAGDVFVRSSTKAGVLPRILQELLAARKVAKRDMKKATDPMVRAVQNGRQLALKVSANSVYGFTGATVGQLPCLAISSSVTAFGREMIHATKKAVEEKYRVSNGYAADAVVVYGDTDSVMVKFGVGDVAASMKLGEEAAEEVSKLFPNPVKLEFEKVYYPYLLMNKKRYAGLYWTRPEKWDKMDTKGIETVRRDNCALVRNVVDTVLRKILIDHSVEDAIAYTKSTISDLLQNKIDISLLVITKALAKGANSEDYANKQAHVELAARIRKRDPSNAPSVGDRIPYVLIQKAKGAKAYEKSEDPLYALEHRLPIDTNYYLENQLAKPLTRIFEPIIDNVSSLFAGDHTLKVSRATPAASSGIMMFAVRKSKCLRCKTPLADNSHTLCEHCAPHEGEVYKSALDEVNELEDRFSRLWTQCQRCQGSLHDDVLCTNNDCPIFYMRKKVAMDLTGATEKLARFDMSW